MTDGTIAESLEGGTQVFTIVNIARRNALKPSMREDLTARIERAHANDAVRVIILRGEGEHFCAGADVSNIAPPEPPSPVHLREHIKGAQNVIRSIVFGSKPVIAAVEGVAVGGGFSIAVACDVAIAAENARYGANFTSIGITGEFGLFTTLPRRVGHQAARRIIYLSEKLSGVEAVNCGLADRLAPPGGALEAALEVAESLAKVPPMAMAATKRAFNGPMHSIEDALRYELDIMPGLARSEDFREAITAFKEKRAPNFTGR